MKDYLLFNACRKKANWFNVMIYIYGDMNLKQMFSSFSIFIFGFFSVVFSRFEKYGDTYWFLDFHVFTFEESFLLEGLLGFKWFFYFFGIFLFVVWGIHLIMCIEKRLSECKKVFDPKLTAGVFNMRFIKFLLFVKSCDEFDVIKNRKIQNSLRFCEQELMVNNYSRYSSHPMFIVSIAFLSAILAVIFNKNLDDLITILTLSALFIFALYLLFGEEISLIKQCTNTRHLCQWLTCFDHDEIECFIQAMKKA